METITNFNDLPIARLYEQALKEFHAFDVRSKAANLAPADLVKALQNDDYEGNRHVLQMAESVLPKLDISDLSFLYHLKAYGREFFYGLHRLIRERYELIERQFEITRDVKKLVFAAQ